MEDLTLEIDVDDANVMRIIAPSPAKSDSCNGTKLDNWHRLWRPHACFACGIICDDKLRMPCCSACKMVRYCDTQCQRAHYATHRAFCTLAQEYKLQAKWYYTSDWIHVSSGQEPAEHADGDEQPACALCGAHPDTEERGLKRTQCCNTLMCASKVDRTMMQFAYPMCFETHKRHSQCAVHQILLERGDCRADDWRVCDECPRCEKHLSLQLGFEWSRSSCLLNAVPSCQLPVDSYHECPQCAKFFFYGFGDTMVLNDRLHCTKCTENYCGASLCDIKGTEESEDILNFNVTHILDPLYVEPKYVRVGVGPMLTVQE